MVDALLIDVMKSGMLALIGSKITKAIGEKEISEIIEGTGWAIVGIDVALIITPIVKGMQTFFDKATNTLNALSNAFEKLTHIPIIGDLVERGMIKAGGSITGN
jgi:hypothetical protein